MNRKVTTTGRDLEQAARIVRDGGLVAIPTETVYGLAADAFNGAAVAGIFAAKNRPKFDPLIVHLGGIDWLPRIVGEVPPLAQDLMTEFWPGPLTILFDKRPCVSDLVTSGLPTVGVRMPNHPLTLELLHICQAPLAAPSANLFGRTSPTRPEHVQQQLAGRIDYILDGGPCAVGVESTIVRVTANSLEILRPGGISREQLERFAPVVAHATNPAELEFQPSAPGQLKEHYAPETRLLLFDRERVEIPAGRVGLLTLRRADLPESLQIREFETVCELSASGDLIEGAAHFFAALHELDACGLDAIVATPFPEHGLGVALNDRLRRAAHG